MHTINMRDPFVIDVQLGYDVISVPKVNFPTINESQRERDRAPLSLCLFVPVSIRTVFKENFF